MNDDLKNTDGGIHYRSYIIESVRSIGDLIGLELRNSSIVYLHKSKVDLGLLSGIEGKLVEVGVRSREEILLVSRLDSISIEGRRIYPFEESKSLVL